MILRRPLVKITREQKIKISRIIRSYGMKKKEGLISSAVIEIPDTDVGGGKPLFLPIKQYNKIVELAYRFDKKGKNMRVNPHKPVQREAL